MNPRHSRQVPHLEGSFWCAVKASVWYTVAKDGTAVTTQDSDVAPQVLPLTRKR